MQGSPPTSPSCNEEWAKISSQCVRLINHYQKHLVEGIDVNGGYTNY